MLKKILIFKWRNFAAILEDIRHERSLILILSKTDRRILKQSGFTDDKVNTKNNLALEKLHRQRILKEYVAEQLLD